MSEQSIPSGFFLRGARDVARDLIGRIIVVVRSGNDVRSGRIVETEAYPPGDRGSHAFRGPTRRNASMFLTGGHIYVYLIYGIHHCLNIVTGPEGSGQAVLIRALEPLEGLTEMWAGRFGEEPPDPMPPAQLRRLCAGPGRLCASLGIGPEFDGERIGTSAVPLAVMDSRTVVRPDGHPVLLLLPGTGVRDDGRGISRRIGLSPDRGGNEPLRFHLRGSPYLSRPDGVPAPS